MMDRPNWLDISVTDVTSTGTEFRTTVVVPDSVRSARIACGTCLLTTTAAVSTRDLSFTIVSKSGGVLFTTPDSGNMVASTVTWFNVQDAGTYRAATFGLDGVAYAVHIPGCGILPTVFAQDRLSIEGLECQVGDKFTNVYFRLVDIEWAF